MAADERITVITTTIAQKGSSCVMFEMRMRVSDQNCAQVVAWSEDLVDHGQPAGDQ